MLLTLRNNAHQIPYCQKAWWFCTYQGIYEWSVKKQALFWCSSVVVKGLKHNFISFSFFLCQDFMTKRVCNLLDEGNAFLRDGDWEKAVTKFSEGLNAWHDVRQNDIHLSEVLLESLYVRRAAAYHNMVRPIYIQEGRTLITFVSVCGRVASRAQNSSFPHLNRTSARVSWNARTKLLLFNATSLVYHNSLLILSYIF